MINKGQFKKGRTFTHSGETRLKISLSKVGKRQSEEHRLKNSESHKGLKRKPLSEETKRKIGLSNSVALKGRKVPKEVLQKMIESRKGYRHSEETKKKLSMARFNNPTIMIGEDHPNWIKDRSKLKLIEKRDTYEYYIWNKECRKRDGKKCKISNLECRGRLEVHHILSWRDHPGLRYEVNNGITLCFFHHPKGRQKEVEMIGEFSRLIINKLHKKHGNI